MAEKNSKIVEEVETEIETCIRNYIKANGYDDDFNCIEEPFDNPVCREEKRDSEGNNIGRYNIEVFGSNLCNGYDEYGSEGGNLENTREERLKAKGYEEGIPAMDCIKYLGED